MTLDAVIPWVALGAAVLADVAAVAGVLLAVRTHRWQKEYDKPQVEITRVDTIKPAAVRGFAAVGPCGPAFYEAREREHELRAVVVNNGNREVYIETVAVEGTGQQQHQPDMVLFVDEEEAAAHPEKVCDRPLGPHGKRRSYSRSISMLNRFVRQEGARVVVRSHLPGERGVLARRDVPANLWP